MRRVDDYADEMPAQDSFLDVITNIVGILILLVVIAGLRTSRAVESASRTQTASMASTAMGEDKLHDAYQSAMVAEGDVRKLIQNAVSSRQETLLREQERMWLNTMVAGAERDIAERRSKLNVQDQRDFDLRRKLSEAQATLDELTRQQVALLSEDPAAAETIECQPTPLAQSIDGEKIYFLLSGNHVAMVPIEELGKLLKDDVNSNSWRLKQEDELVRTVGPINGFRLRYCFERIDVVARGEGGKVAMGSAARLSHCELLPIDSPMGPLGEPFEEVLSPNSEITQYLKQHRPGSTTVVLFTYPGNYSQLRKFKHTLQGMGYQTAPVAVPEGQLITFGANGRRILSE